MHIQQEPWQTYRYRPLPRHGPIPPQVWEQRDMRWALAHRDIAAVYKILQKFGVPQRRIAASTRQTQGEISEIIAGRRVVTSYELLVRIADGLGIPRGWMGLSLDPPLAGDSPEVGIPVD